MLQADQRKLIESWWPHLRRICLICFLLDEEYEEHHITSCPVMKEELLKVKIRDWKVKKVEIGYAAGTCCYKCSRPSDICSMAELGMSSGCKEPDMIIPTVLMGWLREDMSVRNIIEEVAERELKDIEDVFRCMMRKHYERTLSHWGTKGFAAFISILWANKEKLERELMESTSEDEEELSDISKGSNDEDDRGNTRQQIEQVLFEEDSDSDDL
jgi:hypothetical protein